MELNDVIKLRRSSREYKGEKVSKKLIEELLENAKLAPSAANRQPWHFVVLEEKRHEITNIMSEELKKASVIRDRIKEATKEYDPTSSVIESIEIIKEAPVLILVFREKNPNWLEGDYLSIGCAVEHICLSATNLGLGSLWVRDVIYTRIDIAKYLGFADLELVTGVVIGYPEVENYRARKKDLEDIVTYIN